MARTPRSATVAQDTVNHCVWRSNNEMMVFATDEEKEKFRSLLLAHKEKYGILLRSYCLMGTHPHVVSVATQGQAAFSGFWKVVNHRYAVWYNRRHGRRGQVVMERLKSPQIQDEEYLLNAMRYGDLNPVRAGLVKSAKDWRWSSHRHYALGDPDDLVDDAPEYLGLGRDPVERRLAYRHLFAQQLAQPYLVRRADLVSAAFIGTATWIREKLDGLRPSRSPD